MLRHAIVSASLIVSTLGMEARAQSAQPGAEGAQRSHSAGFFIGLGFEGDGLSQNGTTESGGGAGLVLGYGFNRTWSLYGNVSGATMNSADNSGTYSLAHFDVGTRIHFRAGENTVVPFIQAGLSGRAVSQTINGTAVTGSGAGISVGAGLNAHFTPSTALSASVTWGFGNFNNFEVGGTTVTTTAGISATTARVHLGLVWFPN